MWMLAISVPSFELGFLLLGVCALTEWILCYHCLEIHNEEKNSGNDNVLIKITSGWCKRQFTATLIFQGNMLLYNLFYKWHDKE